MYLVTENKNKYLDHFLFYFYFYFVPSTQFILKISRKTFYKKKLALGDTCSRFLWYEYAFKAVLSCVFEI